MGISDDGYLRDEGVKKGKVVEYRAKLRISFKYKPE
jgi:flavin-binding protein dodecin